MPYIAPEDRERLHRRGYALTGAELNYQISHAIDQFLRHGVSGSPRYPDLAEALAAAEGAKREFQRCVMDPYESRKRHAGDQELGAPAEPLYRGLFENE